MKLDDTMLMYGIYNAKTLEKLIHSIHKIHNTSSHEKLFARKPNHSIFRILYAHSLGLQHYSTQFTPVLENYLGQIHINVQGINHPIAYLCISH